MQHDTRSLLVHAAGVALLVAVPLVLRWSFEMAVETVTEGAGGFPWWLPEFGSIGRTVVTYSLALSVLSYLVVPTLVFALGYRYGITRTDATPGE